jgi:hypothetical protein
MGPVFRILALLQRPNGRGSMCALVAAVCLAPAWLFFDPTSYLPRDALAIYRMRSDDFPYCSASRNWTRTVHNLFVPHNTHIVPAWRLVTWGLVAWAGRLSRLPVVLATASFSILVALMLLTGRLVARETGQAWLGLAAMLAVGTSPLVFCAATWYSAGQPLWAGFGIQAMLWYLQGWRRTGGWVRLVLASLAAAAAGWLWTVGHLAGPVGATYLWVDGRSRCRFAAAVPLLASVLAFGVGMSMGGRQIDATLSLHGRTTREAFKPFPGVVHTLQAIPENLVFGNLGLIAETTELQGAVLSFALIATWVWSRSPCWRFNPLESAGVVMVLGSYFFEWSVRGYKLYPELRLVVVPWYDGIPQIGAVLFASGWCAGSRPRSMPRLILPVSRRGGLVVLSIAAGMIALYRPRVETVWRRWPGNAPALLPSERERFPVPWLQTLRTNAVAGNRASWQRRHLRKLEQVEAVGRRLGIGSDAIHRVFGRLPAPDLPEVYDAVDLLDLPHTGPETDAVRIHRALGPLLVVEPEPRPEWIEPGEPWPPETLIPAGEPAAGQPALNRDLQHPAAPDLSLRSGAQEVGRCPS